MNLEIERIHTHAVEQGLYFYVDPKTGYQVMTELTHRERGYCCQSACRHCPYGFQNIS